MTPTRYRHARHTSSSGIASVGRRQMQTAPAKSCKLFKIAHVLRKREGNHVNARRLLTAARPISPYFAISISMACSYGSCSPPCPSWPSFLSPWSFPSFPWSSSRRRPSLSMSALAFIMFASVQSIISAACAETGASARRAVKGWPLVTLPLAILRASRRWLD